MRAEVQLAWKTQAGHRHQVEGLGNEDAVWVTDQHPVFDALLMVADGMGGHPRPKEASEAAVHTARTALSDPARLSAARDVPAALSAALERAQAAVQALRTAPTGKPPGTTLSIAAVCEGQLYVAHVGDGSVFVMREGAARCVAGGEERRAGNRPQQFLGQREPLEPETARLQLQPGDRLLLCTDGLTRYFNEAGRGALEGVLGRDGVPVAAIANQLTAHSRPDSYDDDTTVAVGEVTGFVEPPRPTPRAATPAPDPGPRRPEPAMQPIGSRSPGPLGLALSLLAGAALLAGGFYAGRVTAPAPAAGETAAPELREPATAQELSGLPPGNVVLFDPLNRRIFALATRPTRDLESVSQLQGFRVGPDGRLAEAGQFQLDPVRGQLSLPGGGKVPVEIDHAGATIRVLRGGTLQVDSRPTGAAVSLNGRTVGAAPQRITLPAGRYRLRVEGRTWARETEVEVPAGGAVSLTLAR